MQLLLKILKVFPMVLELIKLIKQAIEKSIEYAKQKKLERDLKKIEDAKKKKDRKDSASDLNDAFRK